jgi:hypothetical protein
MCMSSSYINSKSSNERYFPNPSQTEPAGVSDGCDERRLMRSRHDADARRARQPGQTRYVSIGNRPGNARSLWQTRPLEFQLYP